jgi:hypothetical protein
MTGSERHVRAEARANRILGDERAAAAHAAFVEAQLRRRGMRNLLAALRKLARVLMLAAVAFLSAGIVLGPVASPPPVTRSE